MTNASVAAIDAVPAPAAASPDIDETAHIERSQFVSFAICDEEAAGDSTSSPTFN